MPFVSHLARGLALSVSSAVCVAAAAQQPASSTALEQIIVRGARVPISARRSSSSVTLLEPARLDPAGRPTVGDFLRSSPGVALSRAGGYGALTQLRLRGGEANHVAVFVDGIRVNDPSQSGEFDFAHLLADDVERIEVIRGPQSALWGSDALSGVINIVSARPDSGIHVNAAAESGSQGWSRISGAVGAGASRGHVKISAARVATDGYNVSRAGSERDGYENTSMRLGAGYAISERLSLSFAFNAIDSITDFDETDFSTGLPADGLNTTDKQQHFGAISLSADTFDGRWEHTFSIDRLDTENMTRTQNEFAASGFDTSKAGSVVDMIVYQSAVEVSDSHRVIAALEYRNESFAQRGPITFGDPNRDERMDTQSVIIEYDGQISERLSVLASVRGDRNSQFDDTDTARLSFAWRIGDSSTRLRGALGEGVKNPTFTERYGFFTDFLGNPALRPERSRAWELGLDKRFESAGLRLSATWFDERLEDEINGFVYDPARGGFTAENESGSSRRKGLEIEGDWRASDAFTLGFAWSWLNATEPDPLGEGSGTEIRRPGRTAGLRMRWVPAGTRLDLGLRVDHSSSQDDFFFPPEPPFQRRVTLEEFTLVSLSASWDLRRSVSVFGRVDNALDERYEEVFGFRGAGRQAVIGVRYRFDADR